MRLDENGKNSGTAGSPQIGHFAGGRTAFAAVGFTPFGFAAFAIAVTPLSRDLAS